MTQLKRRHVTAAWLTTTEAVELPRQIRGEPGQLNTRLKHMRLLLLLATEAPVPLAVS